MVRLPTRERGEEVLSIVGLLLPFVGAIVGAIVLGLRGESWVIIAVAAAVGVITGYLAILIIGLLGVERGPTTDIMAGRTTPTPLWWEILFAAVPVLAAVGAALGLGALL